MRKRGHYPQYVPPHQCALGGNVWVGGVSDILHVLGCIYYFGFRLAIIEFLRFTMASRTVLVTGASRGIGLEFVRQLLARGDTVVAACRNPTKAAELQELMTMYSEQRKFLLVAMDVTDPSSVQAAAMIVKGQPWATPIHYLINNAGISSQNHPIDPCEESTKSDMLNV